MATPRENVEFKTLDGLTLRGLLFPAKKKHSPAIILAPGVSYGYATFHSLVAAPRLFGQQLLLLP